MHATSLALYSGALTLCLFSAGTLAARNLRSRRPLHYLTLLLLVQAFGLGCELLMLHPESPLKGLFLGLRLSSALLLAPCVWLALREIAEPGRPPWRSLGGFQLGAMGVGEVLTLPVMMNAHLGTGFVDPARPTGATHSLLIHAGMLGCVIIFAAQVPMLVGRCRRLLITTARPNDGWLRLPLLLVLTTWLLGSARALHCALFSGEEALRPWFAAAEAGGILTILFLMASGVTARRRGTSGPVTTPRRLTHGYPLLTERLPRTQRSSERLMVRRSLAPPTPSLSAGAATQRSAKYARSRLAPEVRRRIREKLSEALAQESFCTDSLQSLRKLARAIHENPHHVSQVINEDFGVSYYDLLSRYRIERAKHLLLARPSQSVLEIALSVGFNSKSTFNAAFRRQTGVTPRAFRASRGQMD